MTVRVRRFEIKISGFTSTERSDDDECTEMADWVANALTPPPDSLDVMLDNEILIAMDDPPKLEPVPVPEAG